MKMRGATVDDIDAIISLIQQNNSENKNHKNREDPNLIKKTIESKDGYISVLEGEATEDQGSKAGKLIGVMIGYHKKFLSNKEFNSDKIVQHLLKNIQYDFVYTDILVVSKEQQGKQYGRMLMLSFLDDTKKNTIIAAAALSPHKNKDSLKLFDGFRFTKEDEITVYDGLTLGIFEYDN